MSFQGSLVQGMAIDGFVTHLNTMFLNMIELEFLKEMYMYSYIM